MRPHVKPSKITIPFECEEEDCVGGESFEAEVEDPDWNKGVEIIKLPSNIGSSKRSERLNISFLTRCTILDITLSLTSILLFKVMVS